jgi:hypothetical protein
MLVIISLFFNLCVIMFTDLFRSNINKLLFFLLPAGLKIIFSTPPPSHLNRIVSQFFYVIPRIVVHVEKRKAYRGLVEIPEVKGHF